MEILLVKAIGLYEWVMIARIVLTWIPHNVQHPAAQVLYKITEPVLNPIRKIIPPVMGIDFSPIIVFVALGFIKRMLFRGLL